MQFKVFRDFRGSQDGIFATEFKAGSVVEISDHLAPHISKWATPLVSAAAEAPVIDAPAVESHAADPAPTDAAPDAAEPKRRGRPPKAR